MTTSKLAAGVAGVALLAVTVGSATVESRARHAATEALVQADTEIARLTDRLRDLQQRITTAEQAVQDDRAELSRSEEAVAPPRATDPIAAGKEFLARHPEASALWEEIARANMAGQLAAHYRAVNLTPDQRSQLESVMAQSVANVSTLRLPDGSITLRRERTMTSSESQARMRQLIGEDAYRQLTTVGKAWSGGLELAAQLAGATYRTEALSPLQMDRVLQAFAAVGTAKSFDSKQWTQSDWDGIIADAMGILSPAQVAALGEVRGREVRRRFGSASSPAGIQRTVAPTAR